MKVRDGFVSNSSSTSFSIFGTLIDNDDLVAMINAKTGKTISEEDLYYSDFNLGPLTVYFGECDSYVGLDYDDLKDDETGAQFKERARVALAQLDSSYATAKLTHYFGEVCTG